MLDASSCRKNIRILFPCLKSLCALIYKITQQLSQVINIHTEKESVSSVKAFVLSYSHAFALLERICVCTIHYFVPYFFMVCLHRKRALGLVQQHSTERLDARKSLRY